LGFWRIYAGEIALICMKQNILQILKLSSDIIDILAQEQHLEAKSTQEEAEDAVTAATPLLREFARLVQDVRERLIKAIGSCVHTPALSGEGTTADLYQYFGRAYNERAEARISQEKIEVISLQLCGLIQQVQSSTR